MAHYQTLSRGEHELNDPSDPWTDEVVDTVSVRPIDAFLQLKVPCINLFFLRFPQYHDEQFNHTHPPTDKFPTLAMSQRTAQQKTRKRRIIWIGVVALVIVVAAVVVGVVLATRKKGSGSSGGSSNGANGGPGGTGSSSSTSGKTGSRVTMEDGSTFVYTNDFGGDWVFDPKLPFAAGGQAQSWTPRVGKDDWVWGQDVVKGVNLG